MCLQQKKESDLTLMRASSTPMAETLCLDYIFFCKNNNFLGIFKEKTGALKYQHGMGHFLVIG
jgi:hypothetical protein